jgi:hypothetical protein
MANSGTINSQDLFYLSSGSYQIKKMENVGLTQLAEGTIPSGSWTPLSVNYLHNDNQLLVCNDDLSLDIFDLDLVHILNIPVPSNGPILAARFPQTIRG